MRLLDTKTLRLHEFIGENVPEYAILSHTWGEEEVSFQEIVAEVRPVDKAGYKKITASCTQACLDGWEYVWIDTCCIDKTSSAELSEAINSMFRWYQGAEICYAYMNDVDNGSSLPEAGDPDQLETFRRSRWFTRGWTLQELLAPKDLIFFDREWRTIGTEWNLRRDISAATNISPRYLRFPEQVSVAARMSWASKRKTTRIEDLAYCLLGIFDVNMPLLYGEGQKAFLRLQHEILRVNRDESLFAWRDPSLDESGMFAQSPAAFAESGNIVPLRRDFRKQDEPMSVTNRGLAIHARLSPRLWLLKAGIEYFDFKDEVAIGSSRLTSNDGKEALKAGVVDTDKIWGFKALLLSCTLNDKPNMAVSIIVRQLKDNIFFRVKPGMLCIHHLHDALSNRSKDTQTVFVGLESIEYSATGSDWVRIRRAPFGRQFSLLHYDRFEDATVVRASSGARSGQVSWDTVSETPMKDEDKWFCTEDNDLFVIPCHNAIRNEVHIYQGGYSSDQAISATTTIRARDEHWESLSEKTANFQMSLLNGRLPSSNWLSVRTGWIIDTIAGGHIIHCIDVVVDKQPLQLEKSKFPVVNSLCKPFSRHIKHRGWHSIVHRLRSI